MILIHPTLECLSVWKRGTLTLSVVRTWSQVRALEMLCSQASHTFYLFALPPSSLNFLVILVNSAPPRHRKEGRRAHSGVIWVRFHLSFTSQIEMGSKPSILRISNPSPNKAKLFSFLTAEARMHCLSPFLYWTALEASHWEPSIIS